MSKEQINELNKGKTMDKTITKKKNGNKGPAWKSINEVSEDELNEALANAKDRSELNKKAGALEVGKGLKVEGDFERIRTGLSIYGKKQGKKFKVVKSKDAGFVLVARIE